jgi:hypothetical protein
LLQDGEHDKPDRQRRHLVRQSVYDRYVTVRCTTVLSVLVACALQSSRWLDVGEDMPGGWLTMSTLVQRIQKEFEEAPGLAITVDGAVRFWALDAATCECVLTHLQATGFLVKSTDGHFRRRPAV